jgi:REP element-mobilizing transposase RayT
VFFATTKTSTARRLLQSERNAMLLIDVLRSNLAAGKFQLHDFVNSPDHLHLLVTLPGDKTIEKASMLPSSTPTATLTWQRKKRRGLNRLRKNPASGEG